jgi:hypothetical protein
VNLRALPALVVIEVLFGIQQRVRSGAKITDVDLRVLCDALRRQQVTSIEADDVELVRNKPARSLINALTRHVRRAQADPGSEQAKDTWDLAIFGHRGNLSFVRITPAMAGPGRQAVGGRAVAPPPRPATVSWPAQTTLPWYALSSGTCSELINVAELWTCTKSTPSRSNAGTRKLPVE